MTLFGITFCVLGSDELFSRPSWGRKIANSIHRFVGLNTLTRVGFSDSEVLFFARVCDNKTRVLRTCFGVGFAFSVLIAYGTRYDTNMSTFNYDTSDTSTQKKNTRCV